MFNNTNGISNNKIQRSEPQQTTEVKPQSQMVHHTDICRVETHWRVNYTVCTAILTCLCMEGPPVTQSKEIMRTLEKEQEEEVERKKWMEEERKQEEEVQRKKWMEEEEIDGHRNKLKYCTI